MREKVLVRAASDPVLPSWNDVAGKLPPVGPLDLELGERARDARSRLDDVAERLSRLPQVRYVGASTGRVDLIIEVVTRTNQDLAAFLLNELVTIEGITDSETNLIVRIYKQSWDWAIRDDDPPGDQGPTAGGRRHDNAT